MKFFGRPYPYPAYDEVECVPIPVGVACGHCNEPIGIMDDGWVCPYLGGCSGPDELAFHRACFMRSTIGSVAHQMRRCSCFVRGSTEEDHPAMTKREAAEAAMAYFYRTFQ